jgi:hypothetical protein
MKHIVIMALLIAVLAGHTSAAGKGPEIRIIDDKISIQAESIPLSRLLRLLDQATGMTSKVPPELANRIISVRFSDLTFDAAIQKIFEGQRLDYAVITGRGIIVTRASQTLTAATAGRPPAQSPFPPPFPQQQMQDPNQFVNDNPAFLPMNNPGGASMPNPPMQMQMQQNAQPMIQTPFGPMVNPNANPAAQGNMNPQNGMPQIYPGGIQGQPMVVPQQQQVVPGLGGTLPGLNTSPTPGAIPGLSTGPPTSPAGPPRKP